MCVLSHIYDACHGNVCRRLASNSNNHSLIKIPLQYGRQNIESVKKRTHPNIVRVDSEDERNTSGVTDVEDDDTVDNATSTTTATATKTTSTTTDTNALNHEFKKPLLPSEIKPTKRKHKKNHSNGNTVISRDDALILVPDGVQNTDGFTFIRTPKGSDNENSDTEVSH